MSDRTDIMAAYRSGFVQRYHANPDMACYGQTLAAHQWGVAVLIRLLHPNPGAALLSAALTHDVGEMVACDLALPFKQAHPEFAEMHRVIEEKARTQIIGFDQPCLTDKDKQWLSLCDALEAFLFTSQKAPHIIAEYDWQIMGFQLRADASDLGPDVFKIISEMVPLQQNRAVGEVIKTMILPAKVQS